MVICPHLVGPIQLRQGSDHTCTIPHICQGQLIQISSPSLPFFDSSLPSPFSSLRWRQGTAADSWWSSLSTKCVSKATFQLVKIHQNPPFSYRPSKILFFQPLALDLHYAAIHQTTHSSLLHSSKLKAILQDSALEQLLCQCVPTHSFSAPHCICQNFESSGKHCHSLSFKLPQNTAHQTQISL